MNRRTVNVLALLAGLAIAGPAAGAVRQVPATYPTIQAAIDAANEGDRIEIAAGSYLEPLRITTKNLVLQGEGAGVTHLGAPSVAMPDGEAGGAAAPLSALLTIEDPGSITIDGLSLEIDGTDGIRVIGGKDLGSGAATFQLTLTNGCLTGSGASGTTGLLVDGTAGSISILVDRMIISNWGTAIRTLGPGAMVVAQNNALTPNLTAAFDNTGSGAPQDARGNWWGSGTGPGGVGPGTGDPVLGSGVTFAPWRLYGTDTDVACGFNPPPDNVIVPVPPDSCLSTANPCLTVPVTISRTDNAHLRGWSVTFQLSPELALCAGPGSIAEGDYLRDVNPATDFHVIDNGGGSYTVDDAILGPPCGATAPFGVLFYIPVTHTGVTGTGTITITAVILRDCTNQPIPGNPGPPVLLEIDVTPAAPVADLAAAQDKSGNDSDGTTRIDLTFTTPPGTAAVAIYRAPFGNYPEYDDAPGAGSVPAVPAWPPGPPWSLTPVTTSGGSDETAVRDFWYFVAFAFDSCGNPSGPSNRTGGTLNYHLGDVHNGVSTCTGDNLVSTSDVSFLGSNYGISLGVSDPLGCLDIGPTLDFSSDARPTTDNLVDFEDLVSLSLNYNLVSAPGILPARLAAYPAGTGGGVAPQAGVHLRFDTIPVTIQPGDTFTVEVVVSSADDEFNAFDLNIAYDPARLTFLATSPVSLQRGSLMTNACANTFHLFTPLPGLLKATMSLLCNNVFVTGPGVIYIVRFIAGNELGLTDISCAVGSQFFRAGFFVNPLDCVTKSVEITGTSDVGTSIPERLRLDVPPAVSGRSSALSVRFQLPQDDAVGFELFDILGRRLAFRSPEHFAAGRHELDWPVPATASGIFIVRLTTGGGEKTQARWLVVR